ncbi:MAG: D-alanyl-D-alanine carboxypeptidase family protein [bacterium]|nr:D-alanyl-D-alanine carboxypeptidase family protein [bacterium]
MKKIWAVIVSLVICFSLLCSDTVYATGLSLLTEDTKESNSEDEDEKDTATNESKESSAAVTNIKYTEDVETQDTLAAIKKSSKLSEKQDSESNDSLGLTSKSVVLMEASTGEILYEKEKDLQMEPASITKIMTMILIFEALDEGKITLNDKVSVSEHAASMGGSQVYLEPNETQTVETMLKCISIASANDACVAMSEYVAGSEQEFVARMNKKAKELGMNNTNFENCCGLDNTTTNHVSTAYDVALMSRELISKHPEVSKYATTWMDTFTHVTKKGETEFGLTNTNKLVRTYNGITGLKTGSTSKAKFCLSATAKRNGMDLIAVVMSAPEPKTRFAEAASLLDYGFANCSLYTDDHKDLVLEPIQVKGGSEDSVTGVPKSSFSYVCLNGKEPTAIQKEVLVRDDVTAPLKKGDEIGTIIYRYGEEEIGRVPIVASQDVREERYRDCFIKVVKRYFLIH